MTSVFVRNVEEAPVKNISSVRMGTESRNLTATGHMVAFDK